MGLGVANRYRTCTVQLDYDIALCIHLGSGAGTPGNTLGCPGDPETLSTPLMDGDLGKISTAEK